MSDTTTAVDVQVLEVVPHLIVKGASEAIAFYERAFGAKAICRMGSPDGEKIWHAEITIGAAKVYLVDEFPGMGQQSPQGLGGSPVTMHIRVDDADAFFARAVEAGATVGMPLMDMFWGDRFGKIADPFGHIWTIAQKIEDVTPETLHERMAAMDPNAECGEAVTA